MASYTQLTSKEVMAILSSYGIAEITRLTPIPGGNANSSFVIRASSTQYVLTVLEEKNKAQATELTNLLRWLRQFNFYTSTLCQTTSGQYLVVWRGKPVILKQWIYGEVVPNLGSIQLEEAGKALATLHQVPAPPFIPKFHPFGLETFDAITGKGIDIAYEAWLEARLIEINRDISAELPKGLIHGDLFFDNILFEGKQLKAIIDFEEACHYYLIFDIGMAVVGICRDQSQISFDKINSFINGYEQVRPIEPSEKDQLQYFVEYAATATSRWRFWKYNIDSPSVTLKDKHWEMAQLAQAVKKVNRKMFFANIFDHP